METITSSRAVHAQEESFKHSPLAAPSEQIRLIRFLEAGPDEHEEISLELSTWLKKDAPIYLAISYTWGAENDLCSIRVNGQKLIVRRNCHYALWQAWLHYPAQYIMIDAICINQNDNHEKSIQVQHMSTTFAAASRVLLCVGPQQDQSERLAEYLHNLADLYKASKPHVGDAPADLHETKEIWASMYGVEQAKEAFETMTAFVSRPYWSRLWVIQEVSFGRERVILCGADLHQWIDMTYLGLFHSLFVFPHFYIVTQMVESRSIMLEDAICQFDGFQCADVRDRVFGILGLLEWQSEHLAIRNADYTMSAFALLLRLINGVEWLDDCIVLRAMAMLEQDPRSIEMCSMIAHAKKGSSSPTGIAQAWLQTLPDMCSSTILCDPPSLIKTSPEGFLEANFVTSPLDAYPIGWNSRYTLYVRDESTMPAGSQAIYCGTSIAAVACCHTRPGDLLVSRSYSRPENLLVLRPADDTTYNVVGQAVSVNGYHPQLDPRHPYPCDKIVQVHLTALETLLLHAQDFLGCGSDEVPMFSPELQLRRVETAVVLSPTPFARVTTYDKNDKQQQMELSRHEIRVGNSQS